MSDGVESGLEERIQPMFLEHAMLEATDPADGPAEVLWPLSGLILGSMRGFTARLYERFNGTWVLCIDAEVAEVRDTMRLRRWVTARTASMPFVQARLDSRPGNKLAVVATHSLLAEDASATAIGQVLGSIDHIVPEWEAAIEALARFETRESQEMARRRRNRDADLHIDPSAIRPRPSAPRRTAAVEESDPATMLTSALAELDALVGLEPVKEVVRRLVAAQRVAGLRREKGLAPVAPSPHLVFTGNPGTGKTTVARVIGRIYRALGLVSKGHVVEADRSSLVAGYVGQTALRTKEVLAEAEGGILFIDEAYSLTSTSSVDYGREVVETVLTHMENKRGDIVVVVAGYPAEMRGFLASNPGLASRFDVRVPFPDYSDDELFRILSGLLTTHDYRPTADAERAMREVIASWERGRGFGNAREVRTLFHDTVATHSLDVLEAGTPGRGRLEVIEACHVPVPRRPATVAPASAAGYL